MHQCAAWSPSDPKGTTKGQTSVDDDTLAATDS